MTEVSLDKLSVFSSSFDKSVISDGNETRVPPRKISKVINNFVGSVVGMLYLFIIETMSPSNTFNTIY